MKRRLMIWIAMMSFAAAFGLATTAAEAVPNNPSGSIDFELSGTTLLMRTQRIWTRTHLRIVGPDGYEAAGTFEAGAVPALDLAIDGRFRARGDRAAPEGVRPDGARRPAALPDGRYLFEAFLVTPDGRPRANGKLTAQGGTLSLAAAVRSPSNRTAASPRRRAPAGTEASGPTNRVLNEDDRIRIFDTADDGITQFVMHSRNPDNDDEFKRWEWRNDRGNLRLHEELFPDFEERVRLFMRGAYEQLGINTGAPARELHLVSTGSYAPEIRLEYLPTGEIWDFGMVFNEGPGLLSFCTASPFYCPLQLSEDADVGVTVNSNLSVLSSREAKRDLVPADLGAVLGRLAELPILEWEYKRAGGARHLGPTAESFHAAFGLGSSERTISPLDVGGVALAAIQALQAELAEERAQGAELWRQLKARRNAVAAQSAKMGRQIERLVRERDVLAGRLELLEEAVQRLQSADE